MQQYIKILLFLILCEAQHVSGDTPPITSSLKLHKQPLVLHTWKVVGRAVVGRAVVGRAVVGRAVVGRAVVGRCKIASNNCTSNNLPRMQKPEAACAVLGSW